MLDSDRSNQTTSCETLIVHGMINISRTRIPACFELPSLLSTDSDHRSLMYPIQLFNSSINEIAFKSSELDVKNWNIRLKQFLLPPPVHAATTYDGLSLSTTIRPIDVVYNLLYLQMVNSPDPTAMRHQPPHYPYHRQNSQMKKAAENFSNELFCYLVDSDPQESVIMLLHIYVQKEEVYYLPRSLIEGNAPA